MANLKVEVVTPDGAAFSGEAISVQAPGASGSFEVLPRHAAMVSALATGTLRITTPDRQVRTFAVEGGVFEVLNDSVIVAVDRVVS
jgi:F-type H+-transporting ATPase subunit epsilon